MLLHLKYLIEAISNLEESEENMKDYIVFDLEYPNRRQNSICSLGIVVVKNGLITDKIYTLINPEDRFDSQNIKVHNIESYMVQDSPTLKEYWIKIEKLFKENIVVGHNIKSDLRILSAALERYDIEPLELRSCCTLEMSKAILSEKKYSLSFLVNKIGYEYEVHNALEDALACHVLLNFLLEKNKAENYIHLYNYEAILKGKIDERLFSNLNDLHGIIQGIIANKKIVSEEIELLQKWVNDNLINKQYQIFNEIITSLEEIIEDNEISDYELHELSTLTNFISKSKIYSADTLAIQVLKGVINGIISDNQIDEMELKTLRTWLNKNDFLMGIYPYDKVLDLVKKVLKDKIVSKEEEKELLIAFDEILNPSEKCSSIITLNEKTFCLTGEFKRGSRSEITKLLEQKGGIAKKSIISKLDYLFIGSVGSESWSFGNYGGKVAKAMELKEKGGSIQILTEDDLCNSELI